MNRLLLLALIAVVGGGIIGGFAVIGGPIHARMVKHDVERGRNLWRLGRHYQCAEAKEPVRSSSCASHLEKPKLADPVTGEPYQYRRLDENAFEVCAVFETDMTNELSEAHRKKLRLDEQVGCLRYGRSDPDTHWMPE